MTVNMLQCYSVTVLQCYSVTVLQCSTVKKNCNFFPMPDAEQWRAPMLRELISSRDGQLVIEHFNTEEIKDFIDHLCVS